MAHIILPHTIANDRLEEARGFRRRIGANLGASASRGPFLPTLAAFATDVAGTLLTVDAEPTEGVEWLRRSARASALFFGRVVFPDRVVPMEITVDVMVGAVNPPPPWQEATARAWVDAMWCTLAIADGTAHAWLTNIPESALLQIGVQTAKLDEYFFPLAETLRAVATRSGHHGKELIRTLEAMPNAARASSRLERIDEPAVRTLFALLEGDQPGYTESLVALLESHRAYAEALASAGPRTLLSLPACALERLARSRGIVSGVVSAYAPELVFTA
ncbi:immunity 49 family protein [Polyangium jinanense]|uniref:Immunity 49 family protein n=1 Tax=Polyangium jinanense TaxID=2829994 RepID=A0A9X3X514_9BACT|nr:immunity 49 family protein [Polyangium jinanense]MDC3962041.1 immunity 49 family protein [Polyangium jinanense]MDC3982393.1 immunity 49 family protein [Polyangium jinanense]